MRVSEQKSIEFAGNERRMEEERERTKWKRKKKDDVGMKMEESEEGEEKKTANEGRRTGNWQRER